VTAAKGPKTDEENVVKIDDSKKPQGYNNVTTPRAGKSAEKPAVSGAPAASSDNVTLSPKAQALTSQTATNGVFDAGKVEEIKAAIASGTFQVDAERVADGLIDTVKDLLSTRKG
jgi:negative regulator of flagellin synthesis FlgM